MDVQKRGSGRMYDNYRHIAFYPLNYSSLPFIEAEEVHVYSSNKVRVGAPRHLKEWREQVTVSQAYKQDTFSKRAERHSN